MATPPPEAPAISAVTVNLKLPPFWPADPELWFAQVEAQFSCRRITSQRSKFDHVVSCLTPQFAAEVRDLLLKPPEERPYDQLKEQLTKRTTASEQRKLQLLFSGEELGDRKPTQFLRRIQQLLGDRPGLTDTSFLQELFLQRLPNNVRMVLASTPDTTSLEKLAEMADKVMEVAAPAIAGIRAGATPTTGATPTMPPPSTAATELTKQVEDLRSEIARLGKQFAQLSRSRSSSRPRSSRRPPTPDPSANDSLCWYHHTFGDKAQRCRQPCTWSSNEQAGD